LAFLVAGRAIPMLWDNDPVAGNRHLSPGN
jgi:hypothetical protein